MKLSISMIRNVASASLFLACASLAHAQVATSSLRGTITDPTGAIIVNVPILLERKDVGFRIVRQSDKNGNYQFLQIAPGTYAMTVKIDGFAAHEATVQLLVDQPSTINVVLKLASDSSSVTVNEAVGLTLNTTDASIGNAIDNETVQALPMEGRNVPDLLSLQPGVLYLGGDNNQAQDSRSGAVAGARSDQGNVTLDGLDNNDQVNGTAFNGVLRSTLDSMQEFRVSTTNSGVDSGRSSGAQVNIVTKSGTNSIHGALYEYNRNTLTAVNDWFNKSAQVQGGLPNIPGKFIRNTFGASVGGPVKKDKVFYFVNFEQQRTAENKQVTQTVPTASFRAGNLIYPDTTGSTYTLTPAKFAALDPHCFALGTCPWGPGANPNILKLFNSYPLPNGTLQGDGYNTASFSWSAPNPIIMTAMIAKFDYTITDKHRLFVRGNLQDDSRLSPPMFPGQVPINTLRDNTKGLAVGEIWTINAQLVNNARFGFTRQGYSNRGGGRGPYVGLNSVSNPTAESYSTLTQVPVNNLVDDLTWSKGKHTVQFGVNYRIIHSITDTDAFSYNGASSSGGEYFDSLANTGQDLDPFSNPAVVTDGGGTHLVASGFNSSYSYAAMNLAGVIASTNLNYVYKVNPDKTGTLLPQGSFIHRDFKTNQFDYYLQDSFHMLSKLTVTFGLRHSLAQTPYEVNGQQVSESISMRDWFNTRVAQAKLGLVDQPTYSYILSGKANGGKPLWQMAKWDIAPRLGVAYAFDTKTSIRAGAGVNYDNFGLAIANHEATGGSAGLLGSTSTPAGWISTSAATRFTGLQDVPLYPATLAQPSAKVTFPFNPPMGAETFAQTVDDGVQTPHSLQADFSIQHELPGGFTLETAYVGRFGRRLMQSRDIAMPLDLVDPKSGMDYFQAADIIENQYYAQAKQANGASFAPDASLIAPVAYWENLFPDAAGAGVNCAPYNVATSALGCKPGNTATQNIFSHFATNPLNASYGIYSMDTACNPGCGGKQNRYYASQYSNLNVESSIGTSSYHAFQAILRHPMHRGLQADFSYTLSKSIDLGSDAERTAGGVGFGSSFTYYSSFSQILNAFNPRLNRAVSDFDTRHMATVDWVYDLPVGHGRSFLSSAHGLTQIVLGGWGNTGLARWTSGLPFGTQIGSGWVTSWSYQDFVVKTGPVKTRTHLTANGPQAFDDPAALQKALNSSGGSPVRFPVPGEIGSRNAFRGDGYFGIDSALNKTWQPRERYALKFAWEVFNVTNSVRFDTNTNNSLQGVVNQGGFGLYSNTLTKGRIQQFSLRLSF